MSENERHCAKRTTNPDKKANTLPVRPLQKNAHSFPLLSALEKELTILKLNQPKPVIKRIPLHAVSSVDSAVDSGGSECELDALDDDLLGNLQLQRSRPAFVV